MPGFLENRKDVFFVHFGGFGPVESVQIILKPERNTAIAYVLFTQREAALRAVVEHIQRLFYTET